MRFDTKTILKALSPKLVEKTITTLDRSAILLSGIAWTAMAGTMFLTIYTLHLTAEAQKASTAALVSEPHLPKTIRKGLDKQDIQPLINRLKKLYPSLEFSQSSGKTLAIGSNDGARFREWLTAISYLDSVTPQYHWSMQEFCVGKCGGKNLMQATLSGEKIFYEAPSPN